MAKKKHTQTASAADFTGVQHEEPTMSAMPIRIDYQAPRTPYLCMPQGNDFLLCKAPPIPQDFNHPDKESRIMAWYQQFKESGGRGVTHLDPYAIRSAFFAVEDSTTAARFMSAAGPFWPFGGVLWSDFQKWQQFFRWLRLPYETVAKDPEGLKAWHAAEGEGLFVELPPVPKARKGGTTAAKAQQKRHKLTELLSIIHMFALRPGRQDDFCLSIQWRAHGDKSFKPCPPLKKFKGKAQEPYLNIEASNILEAIAATIYADRCSGVEYERCKECGKLFRVESGHGQEFCPPPPYPSTVKTSACKNRYTQRQRRARISAEKALAKKKRSPAR